MATGNLMLNFVVANLLKIIVTAQYVKENELSRSFTFAVANTSSIRESDDQIIATRTARSVVHCAHKCLTKKDCRVIGFNAKSGVCWLMKSASRNVVLKSQEKVILMQARIEETREEKVLLEHAQWRSKNDKALGFRERLKNRKIEREYDEVFSSCKEVVVKGRSKGNGIYNINAKEPSTIKTYCHMDELPVCGGGGWTLTMKINGSKNTFDYDSSYWTNKQALQTENGLGLEEEESKLPTYWSTPLTKICLGMKRIYHDTKWLKLELKQPAASFLDVLNADSTKPPYTLLQATKWKDTFLPKAKYTITDTTEGISISMKDTSGKVKVRLGVLYKVKQHYLTYLTYLGFGTWSQFWRPNSYETKISCGYGRETSSGIIEFPAFCYILVQ